MPLDFSGSWGLFQTRRNIVMAEEKPSDFFYIDEENNRIGIGTPIPTTRMHVATDLIEDPTLSGELLFGNIGPSNNAEITIFRNDTAITTGNPLGYIGFAGADTTGNARIDHARIGAVAQGVHAAGSNPTKLIFETTATSSETATERMVIDKDGKVGIGTDSPSYNLQLGAATAGLNLVVGNQATLAELRGGNRLLLGNNVVSSTTVSGQMDIAQTSTTLGARAIKMVDEEGITFHTIDGSVTAGNAFSSERMRIDENGSVGINETVPDYKLDVNGTLGFTPGTSVTPADNGDVVIEATNNTTLTFKLKGSDGTVRSGTITLA